MANKTKLPRCPKGTRRNPKTTLCESKKMKRSKTPNYKPILKMSAAAHSSSPRYPCDNSVPSTAAHSSSPRWIENDSIGLVIYTNINDLSGLNVHNTIAGFDMDGTLITTISGRTFPKDAADWRWLTPEIPHKLATLANTRDTLLVIMSNQSGWDKHEAELRAKVEIMMSAVVMGAKSHSAPFICMFATEHNKYRKPMTGMISALGLQSAAIKGFYVGDAMTKADHSQSDYYFALNAGLQFYYAPDYWGVSAKTTPLPTPLLPAGLTNMQHCTTVQEMSAKVADFAVVIMIGPPAVGKSTLAAYLHDHYSFEIMNNDTTPTKSQYNKRFKELLKRGDKIVIDNTNPAKSSRDELVASFSAATKIAFVDFKVERNVANYLNHYRCERGGKWIPDIVYNIYYKKYEPPVDHDDDDDGYKVFQYVPCYESVDKTKFY